MLVQAQAAALDLAAPEPAWPVAEADTRVPALAEAVQARVPLVLVVGDDAHIERSPPRASDDTEYIPIHVTQHANSFRVL